MVPPEEIAASWAGTAGPYPFRSGAAGAVLADNPLSQAGPNGCLVHMPVRTQGATKRKNARPAGRKPGSIARGAPANAKPAARKAARRPGAAPKARKGAPRAVRPPARTGAAPGRRSPGLARAAAKVARPRKRPAAEREWARALKEHQDPRGPQPILQSERIPGTHNYGQEKNRAPGRLPNLVNWYRKAPKHG
jgi:hypothetical protein